MCSVCVARVENALANTTRELDESPSLRFPRVKFKRFSGRTSRVGANFRTFPRDNVHAPLQSLPRKRRITFPYKESALDSQL